MDSFALVVFGITGNLSQIKLIPVLYDLFDKNLLPAKFIVAGIGRKPYSKSEFRKQLGIQDTDKLIITVSRLEKKNSVGDLIKAMKFIWRYIKAYQAQTKMPTCTKNFLQTFLT